MKTLEQAHQEFNYEQLIQEQLVGQPNAINAYIECCPVSYTHLRAHET